jgi:hypothetical protein
MNSPRSWFQGSRIGLGFLSRWIVMSVAFACCDIGSGEVHLEKTASGCRFHFPAYQGFDYVIGTSTDLKIWNEEDPTDGGGVPIVMEKAVSHRSFFVRVKSVPQYVVFTGSIGIEGSAARELAVSGDGRFSVIVCEEPGGTAVVFADAATGKVFLLHRNSLGYPMSLELEDGTRFVYSGHSPGAGSVMLEVFNAVGVRVDGLKLLSNVPGTFFGFEPAGLNASRFSAKEAISVGAEIWWVTDTTISVTTVANDLAHAKLIQGPLGMAAFVAGVSAKAAGGGAYEKPLEDLAYGLSGASCIYGAGALALAYPTGGLTLPAAGVAALGCAGFVVDTVDRVAKTYFPSDQDRLDEINELAGEASDALAAAGESFVFTPAGVFGTYTNLFGEYSAKIYEAKSKLSSIKSVVSGFSNKETETNGSPSRYAQALEMEETVRDMILLRLDEEKTQVEFQISHLTLVKTQAESSIAILESVLASPDLDPESRASFQQTLTTMETLKSESQAGLEMMQEILPKLVGIQNDIF